MKIEIILTDEQAAAYDAILTGPDATIKTTEYLQGQVDAISRNFVKTADDRRFAAVGLPNLKFMGLDEDQCALVEADAAPKHAARVAAKAAEEAAKSVEGEGL